MIRAGVTGLRGQSGACALGGLVLALPALAAAADDAPWLGTGRHGARTVESRLVLNRSSPLLAPAHRGDVELVARPGTFFEDELLLVVQIQESPPADAGELMIIERSEVGRFEWVRVATESAGRVQLEAPLTQSWLEGTQAVFVPEFSELTITDGGVVTGNPWDGSAGGVVAFLVSGSFRNDGLVDASGLAFRGGTRGIEDPCDGGPPLPRAAGEGIWGRGRSRADFRDTGTGGASGACPEDWLASGGANAGRGGSYANLFGGLPLTRSERTLVLGGGGGAANVGGPARWNGGRGGGAIHIRAGSVDGLGRLNAGAAVPEGDAEGGGGAGGSIDVRALGELRCNAAGARGASPADGWTSMWSGGGGGGRVLLQGSRVDCAVDILAGTSRAGPSSPRSGDAPDYRGVATIIEAPLGPGSEAPGAGGEDAGTSIGRVLSVGCGCASPSGTPSDPTPSATPLTLALAFVLTRRTRVHAARSRRCATEATGGRVRSPR